MKDQLSHEKSLAIISDMIATAKGNVNQSFFHLILWGWAIIIISLTQFYLMQFTDINKNDLQLVWLLTIPTGLVSAIYGYKEGKKEKSTSHIDSIYKWIWFAFIVSIISIMIVSNDNMQSIPLLILIMAGFATFLSGKLIRFNPLVWGGIGFWLWSILGFYLQDDMVLAINAAAIFTGYIIPGYLLKNKFKKDGI